MSIAFAGGALHRRRAREPALQIAFGHDDIAFTVTYPRTMGLPTETRDYAGFSDLAQQQARSRILGGIHFEFDHDASRTYCAKVPEFTADHFMVSRAR